MYVPYVRDVTHGNVVRRWGQGLSPPLRGHVSDIIIIIMDDDGDVDESRSDRQSVGCQAAIRTTLFVKLRSIFENLKTKPT